MFLCKGSGRILDLSILPVNIIKSDCLLVVLLNKKKEVINFV